MIAALFGLFAFAAAQSADLPVEQELDVRELDAGVWMHTSYRDLPEYGRVGSNGLIVERADSVVLIDTAWGEPATEKLMDWVAREIGKPVKLVVITHSHEDRTAGLPVTKAAGAASIGLNKTAQIMMSEGRGGLDIGAVGKSFGIDEGYDGMEVFYPGHGHAEDNIVVYVHRANLLFGGCLIRAADATSMGNTADGNLETWAEAAEAPAERFPGIEVIVPGHGEPGGPELMAHTAELARAARDQ